MDDWISAYNLQSGIFPAPLGIRKPFSVKSNDNIPNKSLKIPIWVTSDHSWFHFQKEIFPQNKTVTHKLSWVSEKKD